MLGIVEPILQPHPEKGNIWILVEDYAVMTKYGLVIVPKGTETDLASVPRIFWNIIPPFGKHSGAAIIHDWLYKNRGQTNGLNLTRAQQDDIFRDLMKQAKVNIVRRNLMYQAVRMFGWTSYPKS